MKHTVLITTLITISLAGCGQKPSEAPPAQTPAAAASTAPAPTATQSPSAATAPSAFPPSHPSLGLMPKDTSKMAQTEPPPLTQKAQVVSATNVKEFTYLEVMQDEKSRWIATTATTAANAKKGDTIEFDNGTTMSNFNSKALNRTFPSITLVGRVIIGNTSK